MPYHTPPHPSSSAFHNTLFSFDLPTIPRQILPYSHLVKPLSTFILTACELGSPVVGVETITTQTILKLAFESWLCGYLTPLYAYPSYFQSLNLNRQSLLIHPLHALPYNESPDAPINLSPRVFGNLLNYTLNSGDFISSYRQTITCLGSDPKKRSTLYPDLASIPEGKASPGKWNAATVHLMNRYTPYTTKIGTIRSTVVCNLSLPHVAPCGSIETPLSHELDLIASELFPAGFATRVGDFKSLHKTPFNPYQAIESVIPSDVITRAAAEKASLKHALTTRLKRSQAEYTRTLDLLTHRGAWSSEHPYAIRADRAGE